MSAGILALLRHGQSTANAEGLFTGILDVPLTGLGHAEARGAAALLHDAGLIPAHVFTSELSRAWETARIVTGDDREVRDWRLDERNYGALTGRSKASVVHDFGAAQFQAWRRSLDQAPPPLGDELYHELAAMEPFRHLPARALVRTEALRQVIDRVGEFFQQSVAPLVRTGDDVLVVAHGNSLRALCSILDSDEIQRLNIPTGQPLTYSFEDALTPTIRGGLYLDEISATAAAVAIANEGGT